MNARIKKAVKVLDRLFSRENRRHTADFANDFVWNFGNGAHIIIENETLYTGRQTDRLDEAGNSVFDVLNVTDLSSGLKEFYEIILP